MVGACVYLVLEHLTVFFGFTGVFGMPWEFFNTSGIRKNSRTGFFQVLPWPKKTETATRQRAQAHDLLNMHVPIVWRACLSQFFGQGSIIHSRCAIGLNKQSGALRKLFCFPKMYRLWGFRIFMLKTWTKSDRPPEKEWKLLLKVRQKVWVTYTCWCLLSHLSKGERH